MVTPSDLLELAHRLMREPDEGAHRAAVSRAYYAAFHHCRAVVEERVGLPGFGTAEDHQRVVDAMRLFAPRDAQALAVLRSARNRADYELSSLVSPAATKASWDIAARLLQFA